MTETKTIFDAEAADHAQGFIESLHHYKGEWAGEPFILEPWERDQIIRPLFGTLNPKTGLRQFNMSYIEVASKNGKSTLCAAVALYMLTSDGEEGAEVYCAAVDREQAGIVFREAVEMAESSGLIEEGYLTVNRTVKRINHPASRSFLQVLSADSFRAEGVNAHAIIFDELHAQPNRQLYDVLRKRMGARREPMMICITTAGFDRKSICWEIRSKIADPIRRGTVDPGNWFVRIWDVPENADWEDEKNWYLANPGLGTIKNLEQMRAEAREAKLVPAQQNAFKRYHLSQWTQAETRAINLKQWDACPRIIGNPEEELANCRCYGGLDLASRTDLAALVLDFPLDDNAHYWLAHFWIPLDNLQERSRRDRVDYATWESEGWITATDGNIIDYDQIRHDINRFCEFYDVQEIAYDPWNATQLALKLQEDDGITMVEFRQGYKSMNIPTKDFLPSISAGKIDHGGNPVLRWMADNLMVRTDPAGNLKPDKEKSTEKIDGIVAGIMAFGRSILHHEEESVYETRGILTI